MSSLIKGPLDGAAAVRELTGRTSEETARRKVGVLHWRSFALTIGCGAQGPNEGATTVIEHVTCTACLSAYTHNDYPAVPRPTGADVEPIAAAMAGDRLPMTPTERAAWLTAGGTAQVLMPVADVENDGDRGPRPSRDPMAAIDQAADAQRAAHVGALLSAVAGLHVDEVRVLAAMARQLPGIKLRAACEAAMAQGWVRSGATRVEVPSSPLARAQSSLLGTWREWIAVILGATSTAARDVAQRDRGDVLADEAARRAGGGS
jgi:hypothetical protein